MFMFENLQVYQKSVDLAEKITNITRDFPKGNFYLTDQLNRAILSVALNITEGNGRWHKNDRKHFFYIARGSTQECVPILELCRRKQLITDEVNLELKKELQIIAKMIYGLIHGLDEKENRVVEKV
jgi:four helix bundle protein